MQPRIDRSPAEGEGGQPAEDDAGLSAELAAVVVGARRRVVRDGDRQIDTAHLLHSLLESDPQARAAVGSSAQLARLFGYLVQRSIGYGLRWQSAVEESDAVAVVTRPARYGGESDEAEGWSPVASAAMRDAHRRAQQRGGTHARGTDLLAALVADPRSRAVEVLERAGIPAPDLRARIEAGLRKLADGGATC